MQDDLNEEYYEQILIPQEKNIPPKDYKSYTTKKIDQITELRDLPKDLIDDMKIVAKVLPFKTNNYVIEELINWKKVPNDPIFRINFPHKDMLQHHHYRLMKKAMEKGDIKLIHNLINFIRAELNPHPAGQKQYNSPIFNGENLIGVQHKYRETALFFPKNCQTCHAYCTFCFRWPQFAFVNGKHKFSSKNIDNFVDYLQENNMITDVLFTGGDPMVMKASQLTNYIKPIIEANLPNLRTIRIGTKALSYWPYRFINDNDTEEVLSLFSDVVDSGLNLAIMAHFNHYNELDSDKLEIAVKNILSTGAQIRTQSPLLKGVNDSAKIWAKMWKKQIDLNMVPYYMFIARNTGAQHYFSVPLINAWKIFKDAYSHVSGIARTARGPVMSCTSGKVLILGPTTIKSNKLLTLSFIQGRNPQWVNRPFFAKYDPNATWMSDLKPAFTTKFFFEVSLNEFLRPYNEIHSRMNADNLIKIDQNKRGDLKNGV